MYVPAPHKPFLHRLARRWAWKIGEGFATLLSKARGFRLPDEPLQPFLHKIPMLLGTYERETVRLLKSLVRPGMTVIDGGAHAGYFTRVLSRLVGPAGKVFAFEIHPQTLKLLHHNTRSLRNVVVIPAALGAKDGRATIYQSDGLSSSHSATATKPGLKPTTQIPMRSISSVLAEHGLSGADFIKLDIEGGEPSVLRTLPDRPTTVIFEVKRYILEAGGETPEQLMQQLIDRGFILSCVGGQTISPDALCTRNKALEKANVLAIHPGRAAEHLLDQ